MADEDELLNCVGVPDEVLLRVDEALFERPLEQVLSQPDLVTSSVDDLLKYRDGSLLGFLLRLNPEQEKHTRWSTKTTGPTLLKGGPGTGKSTVALYRVRAMIEGLRKGGLKTPRILFTTYTNALVKFSQQLLTQLLGADAKLVDVRTADSVVREVAFGNQDLPLAKDALQREVLDAVCATLTFEGNRLQQRAQAQAIARLPREYLLEELNTVIDARRLTSLDAYLTAPASGAPARAQRDAAHGRVARPPRVRQRPREARTAHLAADSREGRGHRRSGEGPAHLGRRRDRRGARPRPCRADAGGPVEGAQSTLSHRRCEPVGLRRLLSLDRRARGPALHRTCRCAEGKPPLDTRGRRGSAALPSAHRGRHGRPRRDARRGEAGVRSQRPVARGPRGRERR